MVRLSRTSRAAYCQFAAFVAHIYDTRPKQSSPKSDYFVFAKDIYDGVKTIFFFEYNDQCGDDRQTYSDDEGISPSPFEFRHSKIHTVPSCDQSQRQENRSDDCEDFHDVVLFNIDLRLVGLADLLDILPCRWSTNSRSRSNFLSIKPKAGSIAAISSVRNSICS